MKSTLRPPPPGRLSHTEEFASELQSSTMKIPPYNATKVLETKPIDSKIHEEFHSLFKSIPPEEALIENYSCALSRDILIQGRIWVGKDHLCFYSNILGWVTNVVISWKEVVGLERRNTAIIFPNAIQVCTINNNRYLFPSFLYREHAFFLMMEVWTQSLLHNSCSASIFEQQTSCNSESSNDLNVEISSLNDIKERNRSVIINNNVNNKEVEIDDLEVKAAVKICGCSDHLGSLTFSQLFPHFGVEKLVNLLFKGDFMRKLYISLGYGNVTDFQWSNSDGSPISSDNINSPMPLEEGSFRRFSAMIPFPLIMLEEQSAHVTITERIIKNNGFVFVFEGDILIMGIPGGPSRIKLKWCISPDSIKRKNVSLLSVIGEAEAPAASWFKESIKKSLLAQTEIMLESLGIILSEEEISFDIKPLLDSVLKSYKAFLVFFAQKYQTIHDAISYFFNKVSYSKIFKQYILLLFFLASIFLLFSMKSQRNFRKDDDFIEHVKKLNMKFDILLQDFI